MRNFKKRKRGNWLCPFACASGLCEIVKWDHHQKKRGTSIDRRIFGASKECDDATRRLQYQLVHWLGFRHDADWSVLAVLDHQIGIDSQLVVYGC